MIMAQPGLRASRLPSGRPRRHRHQRPCSSPRSRFRSRSRPFCRLFLMEINYKACNLVCVSAAQRTLQKVDWKMDPKLNPAHLHVNIPPHSYGDDPQSWLSFACKFNELEIMMFTQGP